MPLLFLFLNFFVFQGAAFALNAVRARVKIEINTRSWPWSGRLLTSTYGSTMGLENFSLEKV
jgi:hypothetical protein